MEKVALRELLKRVAKNFSAAEIIEKSGVEIKRNKPSSYIHDVINAKKISFELADFVLQETVMSGSFVERALAELVAGGVPPDELEKIRNFIESAMVMRRAETSRIAMPASVAAEAERRHLHITKDKNVTAIELKAQEDQPRYPDHQPAPVNLRDSLKRFQIERAEDFGVVPIPKWLDLAAGEGTDLELCEDYLYFRKLPDWKHVHSAVVRGDSMRDTLLPGDIVLMREFEGGKFELPQIENKEERAPLHQWETSSNIKNNDICVLSINDNAPTLKRVVYDTRHGLKRWKMLICADNPPAWGRDFPVETGDKVIFFAKLLGIGDGKYVKR